MLAELCPRSHVRYTSLRLLGSHVEEFVAWLQAQGYPPWPIRRRLCALPRLDGRLRRRGVGRLETVSRAQPLGLARQVSQDDVYVAVVVRSLAGYLDGRGLLARPAAASCEQMVAAYRDHLKRVRGLVDSTLTSHGSTVSEWLAFIGFDRDPAVLRGLGPQQIEAFLRATGERLCRASPQHTAAHLRSFLRFLVSRGEIARGLDASIDTPTARRRRALSRRAGDPSRS